MPHLDILLPFSFPSPELAADLLRALRLPALSLLSARGTAGALQASEDFAHALPHEAWLARRFGLQSGMEQGGSPPVAPAAMAAAGLEADSGQWFMLQPAHLHVARDHLVLTDHRQLGLEEAESRALFDSASALFEEAGVPLRYGDAHTWFLRSDEWRGLKTATMDAACGRNIDIWMPKGAGERAWRKLQNEVQMEWHAHPVNEARAGRGAKPVNSVWLWGGSEAGNAMPQPVYNQVWAPGWSRALAARTQAVPVPANAAALLDAAPERGLLLIDDLSAPALAGDWSSWLEVFHAVEANWLTPLLAGLRAGTLGSLTLVMSDGNRLRETDVSRLSLKKFWLQPSLARLVP